MTDGIKRRNVIREMQKRTIGEALYSKKLGRKPNASAKKIGVLPARQGQGDAEHSNGIAQRRCAQQRQGNGKATAEHSADAHSNGKAKQCKARARQSIAQLSDGRA